MKNLKTLERLQQIHQYIVTENTGSPKELANRLAISERSVHLLIDRLKEMEAQVCYSRKRKTYYYCEDFELRVTISVTVLNNNEVTRIFGGSYFFRKPNSKINIA